MYPAVKAIYENGHITFQEEPPTKEKTNVIVMFIKEESEKPIGVKLGSLVGKGYQIPEDFNE